MCLPGSGSFFCVNPWDCKPSSSSSSDSLSVFASGRRELREAEDWIGASGTAHQEIRQLVPVADANRRLLHVYQHDPLHKNIPATQMMLIIIRTARFNVSITTGLQTLAKSHTFDWQPQSFSQRQSFPRKCTSPACHCRCHNEFAPNLCEERLKLIIWFGTNFNKCHLNT